MAIHTKHRSHRRNRTQSGSGAVCCLICCLAFGMPALASPAAAQTSTPEAALKVAFVYNFTKFAEWPASALAKGTGPLNICVLGKDTLGDAWKALENKNAQGHPIVIRRMEKLDESRGCHVVFVGADARSWVEIFKNAQNQNHLTVSDTESFMKSGGMIELFNGNNRIQFDINLEAAQHANVKISSQVLKLARTISGEKK